jgi:hypothetical protein
MSLVLQVFGYVAAITLQVLILQAMRRGGWRRYPFLFLYVVVDLITNLIEVKPRLSYDTLSPLEKREFLWLFWWDERIIQATLFLLVISLIYRASTDVRPRRMLLAALVGGSLLVALISALVFYDPNVTTGKWMTLWSRNMNFCAAILDLLLWATLIRTRQRDQRVLMISGALGLQFTAGAIGQALRDVSHGTVDFTAVLMVSGNLSCLYLWWQAFRTKSRRLPAQHEAPTLTAHK